MRFWRIRTQEFTVWVRGASRPQDSRRPSGLTRRTPFDTMFCRMNPYTHGLWHEWFEACVSPTGCNIAEFVKEENQNRSNGTNSRRVPIGLAGNMSPVGRGGSIGTTRLTTALLESPTSAGWIRCVRRNLDGESSGRLGSCWRAQALVYRSDHRQLGKELDPDFPVKCHSRPPGREIPNTEILGQGLGGWSTRK